MDLPWAPVAVWIGVPILLVAVIVFVVLATRSRRVPDGIQGVLTRTETYLTGLVGTGALLIAGLSVFGLVAGAVRTFTADPLFVSDMPMGSNEVPDFLADEDAIAAGGYSSVWLDVLGLPVGSRWLFYLELALPLLATLAISVAVAWLAIGLLQGRPFMRAIPNAIGVAAVAVIVSGLGSQATGAFARTSVVEHLGPRDVTGGADASGAWEGLSYLAVNLDLAPVGWAFGLALVAAAFQIGTRLQHDTELLV